MGLKYPKGILTVMETRPMTEKNKPKNEPQDIVSEILKSDMVTDFFLNIFH